MPEFVEVYAKATGRKQLVPAHFLDHPVLGKGIALTPSARDAAKNSGDPDQSWTRAQLDEHAAELGIDSTDLATKADVLDLIASLTDTQTSDDQTGTSDNNPA